MKVSKTPFGIPGQIAVASLTAVILCSSTGSSSFLKHEALQVLGLTLVSIVGVAVVAVILIAIPDFVNGRHRSHHRGRKRERGRLRTRQDGQINYRRQMSRSRERFNQNDYPSSASATSKSVSSQSTSSSSRKKNPSMPPLNFKNTPGRVPINNSVRRFSSPPRLSSQSSLSQYCLNPIAERKLEDLLDYDDYWWRELDSRTQYYALILGYTQVTWDDDFDIEEMPCEDWDWDEMTNEQKAAAQHFGYTKETWME
mmetsp:Transcript_6652/g.16359  ORF Transcript_6652/g.16359 Transcript_6652/m.16359 type:complete len:255 (-) Transcript_6652:581-1345(-)